MNDSSAEAVARGVREEAGIEVRRAEARRCVGSRSSPHGVVEPFHVGRLFVLCEYIGGDLQTGPQTSEVALFAEQWPPTELSTRRVVLSNWSATSSSMRRPEPPMEFD